MEKLTVAAQSAQRRNSIDLVNLNLAASSLDRSGCGREGKKRRKKRLSEWDGQFLCTVRTRGMAAATGKLAWNPASVGEVYLHVASNAALTRSADSDSPTAKRGTFFQLLGGAIRRYWCTDDMVYLGW